MLLILAIALYWNSELPELLRQIMKNNASLHSRDPRRVDADKFGAKTVLPGLQTSIETDSTNALSSAYIAHSTN